MQRKTHEFRNCLMTLLSLSPVNTPTRSFPSLFAGEILEGACRHSTSNIPLVKLALPILSDVNQQPHERPIDKEEAYIDEGYRTDYEHLANDRPSSGIWILL